MLTLPNFPTHGNNLFVVIEYRDNECYCYYYDCAIQGSPWSYDQYTMYCMCSVDDQWCVNSNRLYAIEFTQTHTHYKNPDVGPNELDHTQVILMPYLWTDRGLCQMCDQVSEEGPSWYIKFDYNYLFMGFYWNFYHL